MTNSEKRLIQKILLNQSAIASALAIEIPYPMEETCGTDPLLLIPDELCRLLTEESAQIFRKAFLGPTPLFSIVNGSIVNNIDQPALTAYFFGRLFCGDHPEHCIDTDIWRKGSQPFPNALLCQCFDKLEYRNSRQNKLNKSTPKNAYIVDALFVGEKK